MIKAILQKELIKLKYFLLLSTIFYIVLLAYYYFNLNFSFSTIEPESMMWYKFAQLEDKPYSYFLYFYILYGISYAFTQFLPEVIQKRVKLTIHLPLSLTKIVLYHTIITITIILFFSFIFSIFLLIINSQYYPKELLYIMTKDSIAFTLIGIVSYILVSSLIIEQNKKVLILKLLIFILFIFLSIKSRFFLEDFSLYFVLVMFSLFMLLDSFYSIKHQRLGVIYNSSFTIILIIFTYLSYINYDKNYQKEFYKYYIFYSDILEDFVYQKNFGAHRFEYGVKDKKIFDQKEYESTLPFVYYRDLELQNKLPITINNKIFTKNEIRDSKLSFDYQVKYLEKKEIDFFPLFNPQSNVAMIKFAEEFFGFFENTIKIYDFDNKYLEKSSKELNEILKEKDFSFPAKKIFGKATNIKPFDLGYLILDSKNNLFNLRKYDNNLILKKINLDKNIEIEYIHISENRQKNFSGYAIDRNSNFYLLTWDFELKKLDLELFDYKNMRLRFISEPTHYLVRYDDGNNYFAVRFSKDNLQKLNDIKFEE
ncbi:DUF4857 domain-containing protein [Aliarcobacter lanthieri]|uniref:DUF4857 domain-containing protein n=1 Tax=Aliarcobacter lanthieri TaxID=1355374 RepID=UPI00047B1BA3|nr:DUF4857 domain-containing protein [Aliarcobacter lanthieri]